MKDSGPLEQKSTGLPPETLPKCPIFLLANILIRLALLK
jgi:hypothetical protein